MFKNYSTSFHLPSTLRAEVVLDGGVLHNGWAERSLVSHAELATRNSKRTPSRRCAVPAGWAPSSFGFRFSAEIGEILFHLAWRGLLGCERLAARFEHHQ
jgi:hypothetical protein